VQAYYSLPGQLIKNGLIKPIKKDQRYSAGPQDESENVVCRVARNPFVEGLVVG